MSLRDCNVLTFAPDIKFQKQTRQCWDVQISGAQILLTDPVISWQRMFYIVLSYSIKPLPHPLLGLDSANCLTARTPGPLAKNLEPKDWHSSATFTITSVPGVSKTWRFQMAAVSLLKKNLFIWFGDAPVYEYDIALSEAP